MGRRFCPGGVIVSTLRAICAELGIGAHCWPHHRHPKRLHLVSPAAAGIPGAWTRRFLQLTLTLAGAAMLAGTVPAAAQPPEGKTAQKAPGLTGKMFVEAAELRYDTDKNIVSAEGNARIYYKDRVLEADRVVYNRNTGRVYAEGHAKLTESDGTVIHAERFDLTDDFRDGFIESLRADTPPKPYYWVPGLGYQKGTYKTYFSAPRAERIEGDTTVFDKGTYTTCEACKDNPDKPPLWRVRAKRIIHKNDEKMIYYEDAWLEFSGIPVAYVPFF
jgi:LPS-assembly protein